MVKKIKWFKKSKVKQNNKIILIVGSTKPLLNVDLWAGNHPYYTKLKKNSDISGRIKKFLSKSSF